MKHHFKTNALKSAIAAGLMLAAATIAQPVMAQSSGIIVPGLAVADLETVIANSAAFKTAAQQRQVTYKTQIDQAEARSKQLEAQMKPLIDKFNADNRAANPNQQSLAQQAQQIQKLQQDGQNELNQILKPVVWSQAYVEEQIGNFFNQAVEKAMEKRKISIVLTPEAVFARNPRAYDINQDIVNELNQLIPAAQLVPPADWEPAEIREARARQAAAQSAAGGTPATPATTAGPQPVGR
jgi:Skp family chaperone for outer membrane proteins